MPATDTTLWDYAVTYGGPSLFMTAVFLTVMPLVWFKFVRPRLKNWLSRLAVMLAVWMTAWFIAYGDVLLIAREAKRVCEAEAGLRVYRVATVAGFAGSDDINFWSRKGFKFVEKTHSDGATNRYAPNFPSLELGSAADMISEYEYVYLGWATSARSGRFVPSKRVVRDRKTGEVIGELVRFPMQYGWIDSRIASFSGAAQSYCEGGRPVPQSALSNGQHTLISAVLRPLP